MKQKHTHGKAWKIKNPVWVSQESMDRGLFERETLALYSTKHCGLAPNHLQVFLVSSRWIASLYLGMDKWPPSLLTSLQKTAQPHQQQHNHFHSGLIPYLPTSSLPHYSPTSQRRHRGDQGILFARQIQQHERQSHPEVNQHPPQPQHSPSYWPTYFFVHIQWSGYQAIKLLHGW